MSALVKNFDAYGPVFLCFAKSTYYHNLASTALFVITDTSLKNMHELKLIPGKEMPMLLLNSFLLEKKYGQGCVW